MSMDRILWLNCEIQNFTIFTNFQLIFKAKNKAKSANFDFWQNSIKAFSGKFLRSFARKWVNLQISSLLSHVLIN